MTNNTNDNIVQLVRGAKQKDEEAIRLIMNTYEKKLIFLALSYVKNEADASDVVQDSFISAFSNINDLKDESKLEGWLNRIVRNRSLNMLDSAYKKYTTNFTNIETDDDEIEFDIRDDQIDRQPEMAYDQKARQEIILKILDTLPEAQRTVTVMYYYEDMTMKEIANTLHESMTTIVGRLNSAKDKIKKSVTALQNREDIKLYNLSPLAFFAYIMRLTSGDPVAVPVYTAPVLEGVSAEKTAEAAVSKGASVAGKAATATEAAKAAGGAVAGWKIAAAAALVIAAGGGGYMGYKSLSGQSGNNEPAVSEAGSTDAEPEETAPPVVEEKPASVMWVMEPSIEGEHLLDVGDDDAFGPPVEHTGYSNTWNDSDTEECFILLETSEGADIYDYNGNHKMQTPYLDGEKYSNSKLFYSVLPDYEYLYSVGRLSYISFDGNLNSYNIITDYGFEGGDSSIYLKDGSLMTLYGTEVSDDDLNRIADGQRFIVYIDDGNGGLVGTAVVDSDRNIVSRSDNSTYHKDGMQEFVNGYYWVTNDYQFDQITGETSYGKMSFVNAETGDLITDFLYDDIKWFEDGYAPVKRDGKWGFIDENGNEVTDFIFDDASILYEGNAFVSVDGKYGIIDLAGTLESNIPVNIDTVSENN